MTDKIEIFAMSEDGDRVVLITPWSAVHYFSGAAAKEIGIPFDWWFMLHLAYEVKDQILNELGGEHNSFLNSMADQAFASAGHILSFKWGRINYTITFLAMLLGGVALEDFVG